MDISPAWYGFLAGMSFLFALAFLNRLFGENPADTPQPLDRYESYVQEQLWNLLDEARRITEESA